MSFAKSFFFCFVVFNIEVSGRERKNKYLNIPTGVNVVSAVPFAPFFFFVSHISYRPYRIDKGKFNGSSKKKVFNIYGEKNSCTFGNS